jgi:hypothetical protein
MGCSHSRSPGRSPRAFREGASQRASQRRSPASNARSVEGDRAGRDSSLASFAFGAECSLSRSLPVRTARDELNIPPVDVDLLEARIPSPQGGQTVVFPGGGDQKRALALPGATEAAAAFPGRRPKNSGCMQLRMLPGLARTLGSLNGTVTRSSTSQAPVQQLPLVDDARARICSTGLGLRG